MFQTADLLNIHIEREEVEKRFDLLTAEEKDNILFSWVMRLRELGMIHTNGVGFIGQELSTEVLSGLNMALSFLSLPVYPVEPE